MQADAELSESDGDFADPAVDVERGQRTTRNGQRTTASTSRVDASDWDAKRGTTLSALSEHVQRSVDQLVSNTFAALQTANTDLLLIYLLRAAVSGLLELDDPKETLARRIWADQAPIAKTAIETSLTLGDDLALQLQRLIDQDRASAAILETLLIATQSVPSFCESLRHREWMLIELGSELINWHKRGRFTRLEVILPSEQDGTPQAGRGDLDVRISASKTTCTAGEEFSVFVVLENPFDVPVTLYSVETQIPVELVDVVGEQQRRRSLLAQRPTTANFLENIWRATLGELVLKLQLSSVPDSRIAQAVTATELENQQRTDVPQTIQLSEVTAGGSVTVSNDRSQTFEIYGASPQHIDRLFWRFASFTRGLIPIVLQPGDSVVKQFIFRTKSWLLFTPLSHSMQIQIRYSVDSREHVDSSHYELAVSAAITATMVGALLGGGIGALARILSLGGFAQDQLNAQLTSAALAVILSIISIVSFARKSGVQAIVSVEDFWGGLLIGFLIGFFGQDYALGLIRPH